MRDFKKYDIWQLSHSLTLKIYDITNSFPKEEIYGITSQIRRACLSIPNNIAEGCGRTSDADFSRFLTIALGSTSETEYILILTKDLNFINIDDYEELNKLINIIKNKIYTLKQKLK